MVARYNVTSLIVKLRYLLLKTGEGTEQTAQILATILTTLEIRLEMWYR